MVSICWGPLVSDNEPDIHDDHYGLHSTLLLHGFACLLGAKLHQRRTHCWECNWQHWASYLQRQVRECGLFSGPYRNGNFITSPWTLQHLGFTPCYLFFALQCVILVWADCGLWRLLWADPRLSPLLLYAAPHKVDWPGEYLTRLTLHMTGWIFETRKFLWCDSSECVKRYQVKHDNFFIFSWSVGWACCCLCLSRYRPLGWPRMMLCAPSSSSSLDRSSSTWTGPSLSTYQLWDDVFLMYMCFMVWHESCPPLKFAWLIFTIPLKWWLDCSNLRSNM